MSLTKAALGTVSALVALAASVSEAKGSVMLSSWSNLAIPDNASPVLTIDLNGDSVDDFELYTNGTALYFDGLYADAVVASTEEWNYHLYNQGDLINFADVEANQSLNSGNPYGGIHYIGVQFSASSETYTGWLQLDFTNTDAPLVLSGGWESTPGMTVEAIPEPSSLVFGSAGALMLAAAWNKKRKRV